MSISKCSLSFVLLCSLALLIWGCAAAGTANETVTEIPLLETWSGDYPVTELARLPDGQQDLSAGYIDNAGTFTRIWHAFMPEKTLPVVDFSNNLIVFTRNIQFYNRTSILKISLEHGIAEIIAMETMSALPIEDKVAMGMAVIPRRGIKAIKAGTQKLAVTPFK